MKTAYLLILGLIVLTGCSALSIENRGLPKCSGFDRRPLNSDLWDWNGENVKDTGVLRPPNSAPPKKTSRDPNPNTRIKGNKTEAQPALTQVSEGSQKHSRWNIAASEISCGETYG